jgi:hypothetical protein
MGMQRFEIQGCHGGTEYGAMICEENLGLACTFQLTKSALPGRSNVDIAFLCRLKKVHAKMRHNRGLG